MFRTTSKILEKVFHQQDLLSGKQDSSTLTSNPSITIARDPGSGGRPIAKIVSQKLGFDFYNKTLIEAIAKSAKRRRQIINDVDEKTRTAIQDIIHNLFNPEYISDTTYINHLTDVVLTIASKGNAVILGRGANFIVPPQLVLRVLVTAPQKVRIKRAIKHEKISPKVAKTRIQKIHAERRAFVSQYFHKRYANPNYYDLILNTKYFTLEQSASLITHSFRQKFPTFTQKLASKLPLT